jgi:hypothetical protein
MKKKLSVSEIQVQRVNILMQKMEKLEKFKKQLNPSKTKTQTSDT